MKQLILCMLLAAPLTIAAPMQLNMQQLPEHTQFTYRYASMGQAQQLRFAIENKNLTNHFRQFRAFKPVMLQHYLWRDLRAHVAQYPGAKLRKLPPADLLNYQLQTADTTLRQQLNAELAQLTKERTAFYLHQQYYHQLELPWGELVIIPDHQRFMQDSLQDLLPLATAWHNTLVNMPTRQSLAMLTSWIQQIPYQDLSNRAQSSGESFNPPLKLLKENRGDCDSKAVLLAALLRMLLPDVRLAMVYLPEHALLAVQLTPTNDDMSVSIEGRDYLLVDATGPAQLAPGQIAPQYEIYTRNDHFGYQLL